MAPCPATGRGRGQLVEIVTVPNIDEAAAAVVPRLGTVRRVRIEAFCGVGTTRFAGRLAEITGATHVETDRFAFRLDRPLPYRDCIRRSELGATIPGVCYDVCGFRIGGGS